MSTVSAVIPVYRSAEQVAVQPSADLLRNPAHLKFACGEGLDSSQPQRILTDFAAGAKSDAELLPEQFPYIKNSPALLIPRQTHIDSAFPEQKLHIPVAHPRLFFQQERQRSRHEGRCHAGAAFAGVFSPVVGAAYDGRAGRDNVRLADAGAGRSPAGIVDHPASHHIDLLVVVGAADGDDLAADARSGDGAVLRPHISGGDYDDKPGIPGFVHAADQGGILPHIFAGEGADGDIDNADIVRGLLLSDPAQTGEHIGSITIALLVEDFYGNQMAARRDAAVPSVPGNAASADDAAHMGAVAVIVIGLRVAFHHIAEGSDSITQIFMGKTAGVKHSDPDPSAGEAVGIIPMNLGSCTIHSVSFSLYFTNKVF